MITPSLHDPVTANKLKAIRFDYPAWTPCQVNLMPATWMKYRTALEEVVLAHPALFPGYAKGSKDFDALDNPLYRRGRHVDCWGTVWENVVPGLDSHPVGFPLEDWRLFETYSPPDPLVDDLFGRWNWEENRRQMAAARTAGRLAAGLLPHGFMYMRLFYLRRFENLMIDFADGEPRVWQLIEMVETYNLAVIRKYLELGPELMVFGDDLGLQHSLPISPAMWRIYLKPSYQRMFQLCKQAGALVFMHTDGHILEIIPDLIEAGVDILNPQFRANGLKGLVEWARGRVAIELDLDRQLLPFASPAQIDAHVSEAFEALYLPQGGLLLSAECEPDVPLEIIDCLCTALERVCHLPTQS